MATPPSRLSDLRPGVDYVDPRQAYPAYVKQSLNIVHFLAACERQAIPSDQWPTFDGELILPGPAQQISASAGTPPAKIGIVVGPLSFQLPEFDPFDDDHRGWKRKAECAWREFRAAQFGPYLKMCTQMKKSLVSHGVAVLKKRTRTSGPKRNNLIPCDLRYDLAVKRHVLNISWSNLARPYKDLYRPDQIRRAVTETLASLPLATVPTSGEQAQAPKYSKMPPDESGPATIRESRTP